VFVAIVGAIVALGFTDTGGAMMIRITAAVNSIDC
jgi:hypothetical protein